MFQKCIWVYIKQAYIFEKIIRTSCMYERRIPTAAEMHKAEILTRDIELARDKK